MDWVWVAIRAPVWVPARVLVGVVTRVSVLRVECIYDLSSISQSVD
jgi:hypothetical protein